MHQVENDMGQSGFMECVSVHSDPFTCRHLRGYVMICEVNLVISRPGHFGCMGKAGPIAAFRIGCNAWIELQGSLGRHDQKISQVGVTGTGEVRMTKAYDGFIAILITGTVFIYIRIVSTINRIGNRVGIWT